MQKESTIQAAASVTGDERRFQIKEWKPAAVWSWDILVDNCAICRNHLMEPSIEYQANPTNDPHHLGLQIAWGVCGHCFHLDCIQRWLKTRSVCPLCNKEWDYHKIEHTAHGGQNWTFAGTAY
mmetsp:Transcript_42472/g.74456  ORF Transcript_42472/g.74456 Transcript_42472/m.74456 type:complete len:123 (-) Transcript_42472:233-601(-)